MSTTLISVEAYRSLDVKGKAKARAALSRIKDDAIRGMQFDLAQTAMTRLDEIATSAPKVSVEIDAAAVIAQRVADLRTAASLLESGELAPEGLDVSAVDYSALPVVLSDAGAANKLATAKITRSTVRNKIDAVLERAFEGIEEGTFLTVAQIREAGKTAEYTPSDGAIRARLESGNSEITWVEAVEAVKGQNVFGARVIASS